MTILQGFILMLCVLVATVGLKSKIDILEKRVAYLELMEIYK